MKSKYEKLQEKISNLENEILQLTDYQDHSKARFLPLKIDELDALYSQLHILKK